MKWIIKILAGGIGLIGLMILYFSVTFLFLADKIDIVFSIIVSSVILLNAIFCLLLSWFVIKKYRDQDVKALSITLGISIFSLCINMTRSIHIDMFDKTIGTILLGLFSFLAGYIFHKFFYTMYLKSKLKSNKNISTNLNTNTVESK